MKGNSVGASLKDKKLWLYKEWKSSNQESEQLENSVAPEDGSLLHTPHQGNGKAVLFLLFLFLFVCFKSIPIHALILSSWLTLTGESFICWLLVFLSLTLFLTSTFVHLALFYLAITFFSFNKNGISCLPSFSLFPFACSSSLLISAIPSPSRRGGEPTSFSPRPWLSHLPSSGSFLPVF